MRRMWFACPFLLTTFSFSKTLSYLEGGWHKVAQLQFFFLERLSDIEVVITSCSKGKMGNCGWDGQQDYDLEVVGQEGYSLFLNTSFLPPTLCPWHPQSSMEVTAALPQNRHFEYQDSQIILRNMLWNHCSVSLHLGLRISQNKHLNSMSGPHTFIKSRHSHSLAASGYH